MADEKQYWFHAGVSKINKYNGTYTVRAPDRVFRKKEILELGDWVKWHFNRNSGVLIISHRKLKKDEYEYTEKATKFREGDSEYQLTIPKLFFPDSNGLDSTDIVPQFTDQVQLPEAGFLHFVFNRGMFESHPKSCYVLTQRQYDKKFSDSDDWGGGMSQAPKFYS